MIGGTRSGVPTVQTRGENIFGQSMDHVGADLDRGKGWNDARRWLFAMDGSPLAEHWPISSGRQDDYAIAWWDSVSAALINDWLDRPQAGPASTSWPGGRPAGVALRFIEGPACDVAERYEAARAEAIEGYRLDRLPRA